MLTVSYCGEEYQLLPGRRFSIGREGDLVLDGENPFLHRVFLTIEQEGELWWMSNVGSRLSATALAREGGFQAWLSPGGRVPLVFPAMTVWFTAGETTYEFEVLHDDAPYQTALGGTPVDGDQTIGEIALTREQRMLLVALAEDMLRNFERGAGSVPRSADAARRLGWPITKFNRKLDNVCSKFEQMGVRGLHGGPSRIAVSRKARLVEYALGAHIITKSDLALLANARRPGMVVDLPDEDDDDAIMPGGGSLISDSGCMIAQ